MRKKGCGFENGKFHSSTPKEWLKISSPSEPVRDPFVFRKLIVLLATAPAGVVAFVNLL